MVRWWTCYVLFKQSKKKSTIIIVAKRTVVDKYGIVQWFGSVNSTKQREEKKMK